jgi:hypothetical protein
LLRRRRMVLLFSCTFFSIIIHGWGRAASTSSACFSNSPSPRGKKQMELYK